MTTTTAGSSSFGGSRRSNGSQEIHGKNKHRRAGEENHSAIENTAQDFPVHPFRRASDTAQRAARHSAGTAGEVIERLGGILSQPPQLARDLGKAWKVHKGKKKYGPPFSLEDSPTGTFSGDAAHAVGRRAGLVKRIAIPDEAEEQRLSNLSPVEKVAERRRNGEKIINASGTTVATAGAAAGLLALGLSLGRGSHPEPEAAMPSAAITRVEFSPPRMELSLERDRKLIDPPTPEETAPATGFVEKLQQERNAPSQTIQINGDTITIKIPAGEFLESFTKKFGTPTWSENVRATDVIYDPASGKVINLNDANFDQYQHSNFDRIIEKGTPKKRVLIEFADDVNHPVESSLLAGRTVEIASTDNDDASFESFKRVLKIAEIASAISRQLSGVDEDENPAKTVDENYLKKVIGQDVNLFLKECVDYTPLTTATRAPGNSASLRESVSTFDADLAERVRRLQDYQHIVSGFSTNMSFFEQHGSQPTPINREEIIKNPNKYPWMRTVVDTLSAVADHALGPRGQVVEPSRSR